MGKFSKNSAKNHCFFRHTTQNFSQFPLLLDYRSRILQRIFFVFSGRGAAMIIESLRLFYHLRCFKCCVCHVQLGNGNAGTDVRVRNNKLHCQNCYSNDEGELLSHWSIADTRVANWRKMPVNCRKVAFLWGKKLQSAREIGCKRPLSVQFSQQLEESHF